MSRRRREAAISLVFATLPCARCRETRILAQPCTACGLPPRAGEVNHHVQRRRQIVAAARSYVDARSVDEPRSLEIHDLRRRALSVFPDVQTALKDSAREIGDDAQLGRALHRLAQLASDAAVPQLRPWTTIGSQLHIAVRTLEFAAQTFLDAFVAPTLREAQDIAVRGQSLLDAAADQASIFSRSMDRQNRINETDADHAFEAIADLIMQDQKDGDSILTLDERGKEVARSIIPPEEELAPGSGLTALWASVYVDALLDAETFTRSAKTLYLALRGSTRLREIAEGATWKTNESSAWEAIQDSSRTLEVMLANARHETSSVRATLLFVQDTTEGPQKHLVATLLAATGKQSYDTFMRKDAGDLLQQAEQRFSGLGTFGSFTRSMRNASAHMDFLTEGERVSLRPGPYETTLSAADFGDCALRFLEDYLALQLATTLALLQDGVHVHSGDPALVAKVVLAANGLTRAEISVADRSLTIQGTGTLTHPISTIGALVALFPEATGQLSIKAVDGDRVTILESSLAPFTRRAAPANEDEIAQQLHFIEGCAKTSINSIPFMSQASYRHALAIYAGQALKDDRPIPRLRVLRATAENLSDVHFAALLTHVMRATRLLATGQALDSATKAALDEMAALEATPVPSPLASL